MKALPRSTLHALEPLGVGTAASESLLSYFCRLAVSHSVSTNDLARFVVAQVGHDVRPDFEWQQRNLSGVGEAATTWAAWLSALTGVGNLDQLTLSPWSAVLPAFGLAPRRARWCPHCLAEDREVGRSPYFRLAWEVGPVAACHRHKVALADTCPHCGEAHVRHHGGIVVPGWCTRCGGFLGEGETKPAEPAELWVARQVEDWIARQGMARAMPTAAAVRGTLDTLILGLDGGHYVRFAKRLGLSKSTVHNWLRHEGLPSLKAYLAIALHAGLSLDQVLRGDLVGWTPRSPASQLPLAFDLGVMPRREAARTLDWTAIRIELQGFLKLPEPISVAEAGRRLGVEDRHLYLRANDLARALGERWKQYQVACRDRNRDQLRTQLQGAYDEVVGAGLAFNLTGIRQVVPANELNGVEGVFDLIREVREAPNP